MPDYQFGHRPQEAFLNHSIIEVATDEKLIARIQEDIDFYNKIVGSGNVSRNLKELLMDGLLKQDI